MSRTGLSPADIAKSFRDRCGDGSVEWVYTPMQTWVLLDAADMLDENANLRKERDFYYNQVTENGERAQRAIDALNDENAMLRELVRDMWGCISHIGEYDVFYYDMAKDGCGISCTVNGEHCCADKLHDRMRELGVEP